MASKIEPRQYNSKPHPIVNQETTSRRVCLLVTALLLASGAAISQGYSEKMAYKQHTIDQYTDRVYQLWTLGRRLVGEAYALQGRTFPERHVALVPHYINIKFVRDNRGEFEQSDALWEQYQVLHHEIASRLKGKVLHNFSESNVVCVEWHQKFDQTEQATLKAGKECASCDRVNEAYRPPRSQAKEIEEEGRFFDPKYVDSKKGCGSEALERRACDLFAKKRQEMIHQSQQRPVWCPGRRGR